MDKLGTMTPDELADWVIGWSPKPDEPGPIYVEMRATLRRLARLERVLANVGTTANILQLFVLWGGCAGRY